MPSKEASAGSKKDQLVKQRCIIASPEKTRARCSNKNSAAAEARKSDNALLCNGLSFDERQIFFGAAAHHGRSIRYFSMAVRTIAVGSASCHRCERGLASRIDR